MTSVSTVDPFFACPRVPQWPPYGSMGVAQGVPCPRCFSSTRRDCCHLPRQNGKKTGAMNDSYQSSTKRWTWFILGYNFQLGLQHDKAIAKPRKWYVASPENSAPNPETWDGIYAENSSVCASQCLTIRVKDFNDYCCESLAWPIGDHWDPRFRVLLSM